MIFFLLNTPIAVSSCFNIFSNYKFNNELFFIRFCKCSWQFTKSLFNWSLFWINSRLTLSNSLISSLTNAICLSYYDVRLSILPFLYKKFYLKQCLFQHICHSTFLASSFYALFIWDSSHFDVEVQQSFTQDSWFPHVSGYKFVTNGQFCPL